MSDQRTARKKAVAKVVPKAAPRARPPYFSKLVYDVIETADSLGVSVPTVNRLIYAIPPELRSMKIGNRRCVPVSAINDYIEQRLLAEAQKYAGASSRNGRGKSA